MEVNNIEIFKNNKMSKLIKKIKISLGLEVITGLHIGDSSDNVEIGGVDNPVVRRTIDNIPYIPGSSIKGKIRSLLEQIAGSAEVGGNTEINNLFGYAKENMPSKIIVRDAYLQEESAKNLSDSEFTDLPYTEVKFENTIQRITGKAENPRQTERIPAGAKFDVNFVINVWDTDNKNDLLDLLQKGMKALENDYLGGSGSRGYGQVKFEELKQEVPWKKLLATILFFDAIVVLFAFLNIYYEIENNLVAQIIMVIILIGFYIYASVKQRINPIFFLISLCAVSSVLLFIFLGVDW